ncbi:hypothetical protein A2Z33_05865 [Candidatus Gottesmanbacteria bacterium RBG_16_52_11]|uniref:Uncharacterized protein n=1 Tax=Candidatus Gottesmanbacteria bacterium RBG_16_52_11 TaxID=1798374 RepID=A0A1F5YX85_9BACT|nr:MAG: hypothetical protein A2Z33_05865 [Candidatus Gottesmanbacteria bacterium RBG_16_52_11]
MSRRKKFLLGILIFVLAAYVVYAVLGKPPVTIAKMRFVTGPESPIGSLMVKADVKTAELVITTNGTVTLTGGGKLLSQVSYNPQTLQNSLDLGLRIAVPQQFRLITRPLIWLVKTNIAVGGAFFYYVIPLRATVTYTLS